MKKNEHMKNRRQKIIQAATFFFLALTGLFCVLMIKAYLDGSFHSVESFQNYIERFGIFGPLVLTVFQAVQVVIPMLPGFLGCAAGSVMFGPWTGFLCNYIGISAGSVAAFFLARHFGEPLVRDLFRSVKYDKWASWASGSRSYTAFLFLAMLLPLFPDDYLCYLTGLSKMKAGRFIWIIILGKPWCILAYSYGFSLIK